jgi:Ca2+-binding EF-hand superfamily protein
MQSRIHLPAALIAALLGLQPSVYAASSGTDARLSAQFRKADADHNGMLSRAEVQRGVPWLAKHFDAIDVNRDGQITPDEIRAWRRRARGQRKARGTPKFNDYFARADTDGDGALSRTEAARSLPRVAEKFDRIDTNGDGKVTREEMQAWLAARRAARGGRSDPLR